MKKYKLFKDFLKNKFNSFLDKELKISFDKKNFKEI